MVDPARLDQMLSNLRTYLDLRRRLAAVPREAFLTDPDKIGNAKYHLVIAIECGIDIANHVIASENYRFPRDNADSFVVLAEHGVLPASSREPLSAMARFRNDAVNADLARGKLRRKLPALRQARAGRFRAHHGFLVSQLLAHVDSLDEAIDTVGGQIDLVMAPFAEELARLDTVPGILAPSYRRYLTPTTPPLTREGQQARANRLRAAFPDAAANLEDILAEGDRVAYRLTIRGTHRGDFQGVPPTGKRVTVSFTAIVRIEDGRLIEEWGGLDLYDLRQQIGAG